jgi:hypothetical protein
LSIEEELEVVSPAYFPVISPELAAI